MKQLIIIVAILLNASAYSQTNKTVTLVVSGQGKTQDEAKQNALRNAIEQAFGTFISSKTEILNDNLVKDEIVSVASGNIQKYEIISEVQIPNGDFATSLNATVSVDKLTAFVESKGVVAEFKGSILAANVKQQMLNEKNEIISIKNVSNVCKEILDKSCDFEIQTGTPTQQANDNNQWAVPLTISVKFNSNINYFTTFLYSSIKSLSMSDAEVEQYSQLGKKTFCIVLGDPKGKGGVSNDFNEIKNLLSQNNLNFYLDQGQNLGIREYGAYSGDYLLRDMKSQAKQHYKNLYPYVYYWEKSNSPILYFRNEETIHVLLDLIEYTKHSLLNFEISNGINSRNINQISSKPTYSQRNYPGEQGTYNQSNNLGNDANFKVLLCELMPYLKIKSTGQASAIGRISYCAPSYLFSPEISFENYSKESIKKQLGIGNPFRYNGFKAGDEELFGKKFPFIGPADLLASKISVEKRAGYSGVFYAVISLVDYQKINYECVKFFFKDSISLENIEKVQQYKIVPIIKN